MKRLLNILMLSAAVVLLASSCNDFLNVAPKGMSIPETVEDYELILNSGGVSITNPAFMSPEVYVPVEFLNNFTSITDRAAYEWEEYQYLESQNDGNWSGLYSRIYAVNEVIQNIDAAESTTLNETLRTNVKGQAFADRAKCYFALVNVYAKPYTKANESEPGVPLILENDINQKSSRTTIGEVYNRITADLKSSLDLLPPSVDNLTKMRACRQSALFFLSKVYLFKNQLDSANYYIEEAFKSSSVFLNLNDFLIPEDQITDIFSKSTFPRMANDNDEIIWTGGLYSNYWNMKIYYSTELENMFDKGNDLRFYIWATKIERSGVELPAYRYVAYHSRTFAASTPDMYLQRAELYARAGKVAEAIRDLNTLRQNRYRTGTDYMLSASTAAEALKLVKDERVREFAFTGLNWLDLRRYQSYGESVPTYTRTLKDSKTVTLEPGSNLWTCSIPRYVINKNSNITQNER